MLNDCHSTIREGTRPDDVGGAAQVRAGFVVKLLHPDAVLVGDSDGKARTARRFVVGADRITRFLFGLVEAYGRHRITFGELVLVNGDLGMVIPEVPAEDGYHEISRRVTAFTVRDGQVSTIYDIVNPDKLTHLPR